MRIAGREKKDVAPHDAQYAVGSMPSATRALVPVRQLVGGLQDTVSASAVKDTSVYTKLGEFS